MRRLFLLVITLCILGPIYVNCYWCEVVDRIDTIPGELTDGEERTGASLKSGNVKNKCDMAKRKAEAKRGVLAAARHPDQLPRMGKYQIFGTGAVVIGFLVHDNPPVVLTSGTQVYAQRYANVAEPATSCETRESTGSNSG